MQQLILNEGISPINKVTWRGSQLRVMWWKSKFIVRFQKEVEETDKRKNSKPNRISLPKEIKIHRS
jgi:hypothetical protein